MKRDSIDFHAVPDHQQAMHERLMNWGRWCNGTPGRSVAPMFKQYRPRHFNPLDHVPSPVDQVGAAKIQAAVVLLCLQSDAGTVMAKALQWNYVKPVNPGRMARNLGISAFELAEAVIEGRQALMDRGV